MKAYELLDSPEKWIQLGDGKCPDGRWCIYLAIDECYNGRGTFDAAYAKVLNLLPKNIGMWAWNDAPERTYEEVIAVLKEADV